MPSVAEMPKRPVHPHCRCSVTPIPALAEEFGLSAPDVKASMFGPTDASQTFEEWLRRTDEERPGFAEQYLGKSRHAYWAQGVPIADMVGGLENLGQVLNLSQLQDEHPDLMDADRLDAVEEVGIEPRADWTPEQLLAARQVFRDMPARHFGPMPGEVEAWKRRNEEWTEKMITALREQGLSYSEAFDTAHDALDAVKAWQAESEYIRRRGEDLYYTEDREKAAKQYDILADLADSGGSGYTEKWRGMTRLPDREAFLADYRRSLETGEPVVMDQLQGWGSEDIATDFAKHESGILLHVVSADGETELPGIDIHKWAMDRIFAEEEVISPEGFRVRCTSIETTKAAKFEIPLVHLEWEPISPRAPEEGGA